MIHFVFAPTDLRYLFLKFDNAVDYQCLKQTQKYVNLVDPICYLPSWKATHRPGAPLPTEDYLWEYVTPKGETIFYASIGMWQPLYKYFRDQKWQFDGLEQKWFKNELPHTFEQFCDLVNSWSMTLKLRPYQLEACYKILQWKRSISELCTRSGKTLMAWVIFKYAIEYLGAHKILMIVPSVTLVKQAVEDFAEYDIDGYDGFFKSEMVYASGKLREGANFTVGTYQSLIKYIDKKAKQYNPAFFNDYDIVFVDETHKAKANQIRTLISQPFMQNVKIAFGLSGTIPDDHTTDRYSIHSLLGAMIQKIKSYELINDGFLSPVRVIQHRLHYNDKEKQKKTWLRCAEYCLSDDVIYYMQNELALPEKPKETAMPIKKEVKRKRNEDDISYLERVEENEKLYNRKLELWKVKNEKRYEDWKKKCENKQMKFRKESPRKKKLQNPQFLIQNEKKLPAGLLIAKNNANNLDTPEGWAAYKKTIEGLINADMGANMYHTEVMMAHFFNEKIDHLITVLKCCPNNTLVLAQHREYIKYVWEKVKEAFPERPVIYVIGGSKDQKTFKEVLKNNDNAILIAGFGIMSTGVTLSNLAYEVLLETIYKSKILTLQSIGRTLAKAKPEGCSSATIYDLVDCFDKKIATNKLERISKERIKLYNSSKFPYEIVDIYL